MKTDTHSKRTYWKNLFTIFVSLILVFGNAKSEIQKSDIQFAPPDGIVFYESTKINETRDVGGEKYTSEMLVQSYNEIKKSPDGFTGTSKLINIQMYIGDKKERFPFIERLTNMTITVSLDTLGKIHSVTGLEGWDDYLRTTVHPKVYDIVLSFLGAEAIKKLIVKESTEETEYYMLPLGARIPLPDIVKPSEKVQVKGKDCIRFRYTYNTKMKTLSWNPGPLYQQLRKKQGLAPRNIDYSNIEVTGTADMIIDPKTSLEYGGKLNRKIKVSIDIPGEGKVPIVIEETAERKFDYPEIVAFLQY